MKLGIPRGMAQRFARGRLFATPGALAALSQADTSLFDLVRRHATGDWRGPLHDRRENELAIEAGRRLMSSDTLTTRLRVWVIAEADRSADSLRARRGLRGARRCPAAPPRKASGKSYLGHSRPFRCLTTRLRSCKIEAQEYVDGLLHDKISFLLREALI